MNIADYTEYKTQKDFVKHNQKMADSLIRSRGMLVSGEVSYVISEKLKQLADYEGLRPFIWMFCCTNCGADHIQSPIIKFFDFRIDKVKCYNCQGRSQHD